MHKPELIFTELVTRFHLCIERRSRPEEFPGVDMAVADLSLNAGELLPGTAISPGYNTH